MIRHRSLLALVLLATAAATPPPRAEDPPVRPGEPRLEGPRGLVPRAVGDTLSYRMRWGVGLRATGYLVTVLSSRPGWTGLPNNSAIADTSTSWKAIAPPGWDSTTFTATVISTRGALRSAARSLRWAVNAGVGQPGPIVLDTTLQLARLDLKPDSIRLAPLAQVQFCPFIQFRDGAVAMRGQDAPQCSLQYAQLGAVIKRASAAQQAVADLVCIDWQATGGTITPDPCMLPPGFDGVRSRALRLVQTVRLQRRGTYLARAG